MAYSSENGCKPYPTDSLIPLLNVRATDGGAPRVTALPSVAYFCRNAVKTLGRIHGLDVKGMFWGSRVSKNTKENLTNTSLVGGKKRVGMRRSSKKLLTVVLSIYRD